MQVKKLNSQNISQSFNFNLSDKTIKLIEKSTGLSKEEMINLPMHDSIELMKKRGSLKEPSKLKLLVSNLYRKFGEKIGFIEKKQNIYTHID